jgi:nucleoid-associated protein YgaU
MSRYDDATLEFARAHSYDDRGEVIVSDGAPITHPRSTFYRSLDHSVPEDPFVYRAVQGDTMWLLANAAMGEPTEWWRVADANPQVRYPLDLKAGMPLRFPVL